MKNYRTGLGFDLHKITAAKKYLILGGVKIDCGFGLEAVSDGDVILHAVSDAICGAACLGDIGDYYPDSKRNRGIDSKKIAGDILARIKGKYELVNIDVTVVAERPRLVSYKGKMINSLKSIFKISEINLGIKSKESSRALGPADAVSCLVSVLLYKHKGNESL